jgi:hypothetical protein
MGKKAKYGQWLGFVKEVTTRTQFNGSAMCRKYGITNAATATMREMGYLKAAQNSGCVYIGPRPDTDAGLHKLAKEVRSAALNRQRVYRAKAIAANAKGTQTELKVQYVPAPKHIPQPQPVGLVRRFIRWIW